MLTRLAALVLSIGIGLTLVPMTGGSAAATPYDELPVGAPTTLPWWQDGELHVGQTVIATRRSDVASRSGTTLVATDEYRRMGRDATWFLVDEDRLVRLPMRTRTDQPLISADGRWVAWLEVRARDTDRYRRVERYRVVVFDVDRQRVANFFRDRRLVAWEDGINGIWLRTLSNDGRLVLSRGSDGVQVLSPVGRPVRFGGPHLGNGAAVDGWPRGTTVYRPQSGRSRYGVVDEDGGFEPVGSFTVEFAGLWAFDGSAYAYTDLDATTRRVRHLDGRTVTLATPDDLDELRVVGWESADAVVLWSYRDWTDDQVSHLVRCSATTGACEQAAGPQSGSYATMPSRY